MTKFLLDSGDINEYKQIQDLAHQHNTELWGSTTNPSLIAKKLAGQKVSQDEAFNTLQKQIITEILTVVPGAVSAEVYASHNTLAEDMIKQGEMIATWDPRVVVKLPTTVESFKARTELRKQGICINNTLVFSQEQVFAITLHEKLMIQMYGKPKTAWPCFISPFVGRLDDINQDGMSFIDHSMSMLRENFDSDVVWMLEASVRTAAHMKKGIELNVELITAPAKIYQEWFSMSDEQKSAIDTTTPNLEEIPVWTPPTELLTISTLEEFMDAIVTGKLNISHPLTDKGVDRFVSDWAAIIS